MGILKSNLPNGEMQIELGKAWGKLVSQLGILLRALWFVAQPGQVWRVCYEIVSFLMSLK